MLNTPRTARNGTIAALALTLTLSVLTMGAATASAGTGQLSLESGVRQTELTIRPARTSSLGEAVLAGVLLASALASLAWLRSRQTRLIRAGTPDSR